jgi:hypothetical protein
MTSVRSGRQRMRGLHTAGGRDCSFVHSVRTGPGVDPVFCSVDAEGEVDGEWDWTFRPSKGDSKNAWRYTSNPPLKCLFLVFCFFKQRGNFTFAVLTWLRTLSTCEAMSHISQSDVPFTLTSVGTRPHRTAQYIFRQFHCKFANSKGRSFFLILWYNIYLDIAVWIFWIYAFPSCKVNIHVPEAYCCEHESWRNTFRRIAT